MSITSLDIAAMLARLDEAETAVMFYEGARFHGSASNNTARGSRIWRTWFATAS